jgi:hypothetical protein
MVISADFEKQKQYFDKKILLLSKKYCFINIALSLYLNIACKNFSADESLTLNFLEDQL